MGPLRIGLETYSCWCPKSWPPRWEPNPTERSGFSIRQIGIWRCRDDEVVKDLHHRGRGLDMREVPDSADHLKPATPHGVVSGAEMRSRRLGAVSPDDGFRDALDGNGFGNETRRNRGDEVERAVID
jgi:hypothetical protein